MNLKTATEIKDAFAYLKGEQYSDIGYIAQIFISSKDSKKLKHHTNQRVINNYIVPSILPEYINEDLTVYLQITSKHIPSASDFRPLTWYFKKYPEKNTTSYKEIPD